MTSLTARTASSSSSVRRPFSGPASLTATVTQRRGNWNPHPQLAQDGTRGTGVLPASPVPTKASGPPFSSCSSP